MDWAFNSPFGRKAAKARDCWVATLLLQATGSYICSCYYSDPSTLAYRLRGVIQQCGTPTGSA